MKAIASILVASAVLAAASCAHQPAAPSAEPSKEARTSQAPVEDPTEQAETKAKDEAASGPTAIKEGDVEAGPTAAVVGGPSDLPKEAPSPTPTMSDYLKNYLGIPTEVRPTSEASPTPEAKPTSELIEPGSIDLLEDPRTSPNFIKIHDWIADVVDKTGELPTKLSAELSAISSDPNAYIPQIIFRLDDDPDTEDKTEGLTAGVIFMTDQEFKQIYGFNPTLSEEELQECKRAAFSPFLEDWQNPNVWKFGPNSKQKLWVVTDKDTNEKQFLYKQKEINSKDRTAYKGLKINQPIVK